MSAYHGWQTLRELDLRLGAAKGTAFRAFRRLESRYAEGSDYVLLDASHSPELLAALRAADRLYRSSPRPLLLSPALADAVLAAARNPPVTGR
ncbi:MAG TPA: hypothetical protein VFV11_04285 [Solimonas sp.]|nr:hypothetical protein [Solimonas sp.]